MNALELPGGKVSLAVTFYETGQIQPPSGQDAAPGGIAGAFSSEASCSMRLGGAPEEVVIEWPPATSARCSRARGDRLADAMTPSRRDRGSPAPLRTRQ